MGNRLPTYQPVSVVANRGSGVGELATISPLEALVARLTASKTARAPEPSPPDPLAALLETRLQDLTEPLPVASSILGETVFLVANDRQVAAIQAKGGTAYTPPEVAILRELYATVRSEVWAERLKLIHQAKREFQGRLEQ